MRINHIIVQRIRKQIDSFGNELTRRNKQTSKIFEDRSSDYVTDKLFSRLKSQLLL